MRLLCRLIAAALAAVVLVACDQEPPPLLDPLSAGARVLAFGDSLTHGTGGQGRSYPEMLAELTGLDVVAAGMPGERSAQALKRFAHVLERTRPRLVILCTGGNDIMKRTDDQIESNLRKMVDLAQAKGADVVLVSVPRLSIVPMNHSAYARVAAERRLWIEDGVLKRVLHDDRFKSDWAHPNAEGYREIALALADLLGRAGAI